MANKIAGLAHGRPGTTQKVAYTGVAGTISTAVGSQTRIVRVVVTSNAYISFGTAPTATTSDVYMPANVPEYFTIPPGDKVSAVQDAAGGNLIVTEITY